jgi:hypothetical protein
MVLLGYYWFANAFFSHSSSAGDAQARPDPEQRAAWLTFSPQ